GSCCKDCPKLSSCKYACPLLADKIKALKADAKAQKTQEKIAQEEKDRPAVEYIQGVYSRIGQARKAANVSVEDLYKAQKVLYANSDAEKQEKMESGAAKISTNTTLPFGYSFTHSDAKRLCAVADLLQVSIDYLLGRTENPKGFGGEAAVDAPAESMWHTGEPPQPGDYVAIIVDIDCLYADNITWDGNHWRTFGDNDSVLLWTPMPEVP
ncbi:MAG: helix-turn-helix domain-containing protein, partial [Faecousia sp.]